MYCSGCQFGHAAGSSFIFKRAAVCSRLSAPPGSKFQVCLNCAVSSSKSFFLICAIYFCAVSVIHSLRNLRSLCKSKSTGLKNVQSSSCRRELVCVGCSIDSYNEEKAFREVSPATPAAKSMPRVPVHMLSTATQL